MNSTLLVSSDQNKEHVSDVQLDVLDSTPLVLVDSISVMILQADNKPNDLQREDSNEINDTKSNSTNLSHYSVEAKHTKIYSPLFITNQDDELLHHNTARENKEILAGAFDVDNNDSISNLQDGHVTDYGSSVASRSDSSCSGSNMIAPWCAYKENNEASTQPKQSNQVVRESSYNSDELTPDDHKEQNDSEEDNVDRIDYL
jgi:hypothetical protein